MRRSDIEVPNLPVDVASALARSLDYTFTSFEGAACYGRDRLTPKRRTSISCTLQEVVTGEPRAACRQFAGAARNSHCGEEPSLGIARAPCAGSTDMSR